MALDTLADVIARVRFLLSDLVAEYRYSDQSICQALDAAVLEALRVRPDLFLAEMRTGIYPSFDPTKPTTAITIDPRYRQAFVFYAVGYCALSDEQNNEDQRATVFMNKFVTQLQSPQS